ncbi:MAG: Ig domain-containing protein [Steroidobacteraceae bacterium]
MSSLTRAIGGLLVAALIASCGGGGSGGGGTGPLNITSTTVNDGVVGVAYNDTIDATGGTGTRTFSVTAGALPAGLTLSAAGAITGTPAGPAVTANFSVTVTDSANQPQTDTQALTIDIVEPLAVTFTAVTTTSVGAAYSQSLGVSGGTAPYTFSVSAGSLPDGLALSAGGAITGTTAASATTQTFNARVTDSSAPALIADTKLIIVVTLEITTTALPDASGGEAYSASLEAQGGRLPLDWSLIAGALPAGLVGPDPATGEISGTPDPVCAAAATALTAQVIDSDSPAQSDTQAAIALTVNPAPLDITSPTMPNGTVGMAYNAAVQVSGGMPPYNFAITNGTLPSQLTINAATGQITGTPDTIETQTFDVTVTDACPDSVTEPVSITINAVPPGRNDSIADATVLPGNGTYSASISPSGHPNTVFDPDEDYYEITTTAASTVTVDINADVNGSPLDSVIEIVGANGVQLSTCVSPAFTSPCEHDDETLGVDLDSFLEIQVGGATTFYIHVVDFGSNARPDKLYDLVISGVN